VSRPAIFISALTVVWGVTSVSMGFVQTFGQALACRVILALCACSLDSRADDAAPKVRFGPSSRSCCRGTTLGPKSARASAGYTSARTARRQLSGCELLRLQITSDRRRVAAGVLDNLDGFHGHAAWRWLCVAAERATGSLHRYWLVGSCTLALAVAVLLLVPGRDPCVRDFVDCPDLQHLAHAGREGPRHPPRCL